MVFTTPQKDNERSRSPLELRGCERSSWGLTPTQRQRTVNSEEADQDTEEEFGYWHYLVVDRKGLRARHSAVYDQKAKLKGAKRFAEGTVVKISSRLRCGGTVYLKLAEEPGWLFDICPKDRSVRMLEVAVDPRFYTGDWRGRSWLAKTSLEWDDRDLVERD